MAVSSLVVSEWSNFMIAEASAAATLTGLVFVAVSINLPRILSFPGLPGRAAESLWQLFGALVVSTTALIPGQPLRAFGIELLGIGTTLLIAQLILQIRNIRANPDHPRAWFVQRMLLSLLATLPFCVAGLSILVRFPGGLYWMVPGFFFSFIAGVTSAWVLLIEILR
jgi:modulator of FtsH protease